ncbi:MAG: AbrB/MazE/SpoVT family DNA-binding domain-containing protein [Candidatus Nanoarchaeia archaeon]
MKQCTSCNTNLVEKSSFTPDKVPYKYHACPKCGEEILDRNQLHEVAQKYRTLKKFHVKLSKWGLSLGLRIPKELIEKYHFRPNEEVTIIPEEDGLKIVPL